MRSVVWSVKGVPFFPLTFLTNGDRAVELFFILSGFVLTLPYALGVREMTNLRDILHFYRHRAARLIPLYALCVLISMIFIVHPPLEPALFARDIAWMATFTFHFVKNMWYPHYNGDLWSIGVEVWFAVLFPFLLIFKRKTSLRTLILAMLFIGLFIKTLGAWRLGLGRQYVTDNFLSFLDTFGVGMLIAYAYAKQYRPGRWAVPLGLLLILGAGQLIDYMYSGSVVRLLYAPAIEMINIGFFFVILRLLYSTGWFVRTFVASVPLQLIGMMSYSLYVWHSLIIGSFRSADSLWLLTVSMLLLGALSLLTYRFVEFRSVADWRELLPSSLRRPFPHPQAK